MRRKRLGKRENKMDQRTAPYATLLLRLTLGAFFILHIYRKFAIIGFSVWWTGLQHNGYPDWVILYVLISEFAAAILLPLGLWTRWASLFVLPALIGVSQYWFVRRGFWFTASGAELPVLWAFGLAALALLGDGAYALRWRSAVSDAGLRVRPPPTTQTASRSAASLGH
jgi:putative oxidoreductase